MGIPDLLQKTKNTIDSIEHPIYDMVGDLVNAGTQLKYDLGLRKIHYAYIQKVIGAGYPIFVVSYDSHRPDLFLSPIKVKNTKATQIGKIKQQGVHFYLRDVKMTPPLPIESSLTNLSSGYIFILRDLAGSILIDEKMYECVNDTNNKIILKEVLD